MGKQITIYDNECRPIGVRRFVANSELWMEYDMLIPAGKDYEIFHVGTDKLLASRNKLTRKQIKELFVRHDNVILETNTNKKTAKRVKMFDLDMNFVAEFSSIRMAEKLLGIPYTSIVSSMKYSKGGMPRNKYRAFFRYSE